MVDTSDRADGIVWRYLTGGHVAHALTAGTHGRADVAVCGITSRRAGDADPWRGTRDSGERAALTLFDQCPRCRRVLASQRRRRASV